MKKLDQPVIEVKYERTGNHGSVSTATAVATFEIQGVSEREDIRSREYQSIYSKYSTDRLVMRLEDYSIPLWGEGHNLYPQEVAATVQEHKLIPQLLDKQVKFLFGKGPRLYKEEIQGEGDQQHRVRVPVDHPGIQAWLESWEDRGYNHYWDYIRNCATDYYNVKTCVTKYQFNRSRRLGNPASIDALTYVGSDEARLAATGVWTNKRIKSEDCNFVIVGDWLYISTHQYDVYPRFDPRNPAKFPVSIAFNSEKTFSKWVYAFNDWFKGAYEYIKSSNLAPKYTNSYFKNALNAHIHVIIPGTWYQAQKTILTDICQNNLMGDENTPMQTNYRGVKLVDDSGKPYRFYETMMDDLIGAELKRITGLMSGEGKNQGKLYATTKWGEDGWKFEEFPGKFKEFIEAINSNDKRSDQVVLASLGIPGAITGVDKDGVISLAGADVYYNYLLYVSTLTLPEYFILKEINRAIRINFPDAKNIKLGFWIDIPAKQQDTTPSARLGNTATSDPTKTPNP